MDLDRESFSCSICLELLKEPASLPCGHSYCMSCIQSHWEEEEVKKSYSCPQCRQRFTPRPVLLKNTMLCVLMEGLKKSEAPAPECPSSAEQGHVFCDLCSGSKVKAFKSCLQCLVSYCKEHLQPHYDVAALKKHKLLEPRENLQENMCSLHDEVMKMFCRTEQQCICYLCSVDQHRGHHTVTAAAERTEKQRELLALQQNLLHTLSHKQKHLHTLQQHLENTGLSADAAVELSDRSLTELLHLLEKRLSLVKQQVRARQEAEEHRVKDVQDKVQQEISEMKRNLTELDTLSHSEDHVHFLHRFLSLSRKRESSASGNSRERPPPFQNMVRAAMSKLRSSLEETTLMDPPAASNKAPVKTATTEELPAGAAASPQTQQPPSHTPEEGVDSLEKKFRLFPKGYFSREVTDCVRAPQQDSAGGLRDPAVTPHTNKVLPPGAKHISTAERPAPQRNSETQPEGSAPQCPPPQCPPPQCPPPQCPPPQCPPPQCPPSSSVFRSTRALQEFVRELTLDPHSLHDTMHLSEDDTVVGLYDWSQNYSHTSGRFTHFLQVVSKQRLTGRRSWMVEFVEDLGVTVAVAYPKIKRRGSSNDCAFGQNENSWALKVTEDVCEFWHKGVCLNCVFNPGTGKIVVYLDMNAGILSFYWRREVELEHIHTVSTSFTMPLVAGLGLHVPGSYARICGPEYF